MPLKRNVNQLNMNKRNETLKDKNDLISSLYRECDDVIAK